MIDNSVNPEKQLTRTEATLVASWLEKQGKKVVSGWIDVWKLTPTQVGIAFNVSAEEVEKIARRSSDE